MSQWVKMRFLEEIFLLQRTRRGPSRVIGHSCTFTSQSRRRITCVGENNPEAVSWFGFIVNRIPSIREATWIFFPCPFTIHLPHCKFFDSRLWTNMAWQLHQIWSPVCCLLISCKFFSHGREAVQQDTSETEPVTRTDDSRYLTPLALQENTVSYLVRLTTIPYKPSVRSSFLPKALPLL